MARLRNTEDWFVLEDRVPMQERMEKTSFGDVDLMLCFVQEPRETEDGHAYKAQIVGLDEDSKCGVTFDLFEQAELGNVGTLNKTQKKMINDNIDIINAEEDAMRTCLSATAVKPTNKSTGRPGLLTKLLCLLPCIFQVEGITSQVVGTPKQYRQAERFVSQFQPDMLVGYSDSVSEPDKS